MNYKMPYPIHDYSTRNRRRPNLTTLNRIRIAQTIAFLLAAGVLFGYGISVIINN